MLTNTKCTQWSFGVAWKKATRFVSARIRHCLHHLLSFSRLILLLSHTAPSLNTAPHWRNCVQNGMTLHHHHQIWWLFIERQIKPGTL